MSVQTIDLANKIRKDISKDWSEEIESINFHKIFKPVYSLKESIEKRNCIVSYIILSYDNESKWIDLRQDRQDNKLKIMSSLVKKMNKAYQEIINNDDDTVNTVIANYIADQADWRWKAIVTQLDYYSRMLRFVSEKTDTEKSFDKIDKDGGKKTLFQEYDIDKITKVNKDKGDLLVKAIEARREADQLIAEIKKDFMQLDHIVQSDFGFEITDEKKINPESWADFIRYSKLKMVKQ